MGEAFFVLLILCRQVVQRPRNGGGPRGRCTCQDYPYVPSCDHRLRGSLYGLHGLLSPKAAFVCLTKDKKGFRWVKIIIVIGLLLIFFYFFIYSNFLFIYINLL
jgi:hypothetical protein